MNTKPQTSENARWSCSQCGDCCRLYTLGPVEPEVVADLKTRGISTQWPIASEGWVETRQTQNGPAYFLKHRDGACVFLEADNKCAVHRLYGEEAKPGFCRTFPFDRVRVLNQETFTIRPECSGYGLTFDTGTPMVQRADALLEEDVPTPRYWSPDTVALGLGVGVDLKTWVDAEKALLQRLRQARVEGHPICVVRDAMMSALPDSVTEHWQRAVLRAPPSREIVLQVFRGLFQALNERSFDGPDEARTHFLRQMRDRLDGLQRPGTEPQALSQNTREFSWLLVEDALLSKRLFSYGSLLAGLGATVLAFAATSTGHAEPAPIPAERFHRRLAEWTRFTAHPTILGMLRSNHRVLESLALVTREEDLRENPPRTPDRQ